MTKGQGEVGGGAKRPINRSDVEDGGGADRKVGAPNCRNCAALVEAGLLDPFQKQKDCSRKLRVSASFCPRPFDVNASE